MIRKNLSDMFSSHGNSLKLKINIPGRLPPLLMTLNIEMVQIISKQELQTHRQNPIYYYYLIRVTISLFRYPN